MSKHPGTPHAHDKEYDADLERRIRVTIEDHEFLSLDSQRDREVLIKAILTALTEA